VNKGVAVSVAAAAAVAAALLVSGGEASDPRTPPPLPGYPAPFLGTVVVAGGGLAAALDSYGNVVDLRLPGAAGEAQIDNPAAAQSAGSVDPRTGIVIRAGSGRALPLWRARRIRQDYRRGTNVVVTHASVGGAGIELADAAAPQGATLARLIDVRGPAGAATLALATNLDLGGDVGGDRVTVLPRGFRQAGGGRAVRCAATPPPRVTLSEGDDVRVLLRWRGREQLHVSLSCSFAGPPPTAARVVSAASRADRRWLRRGEPLAAPAPGWARDLHDRSLLVLRALTNARTGAVAAGVRDEWSYVWPRDSGAAALAFAAAGHELEAMRTARFLQRLDLEAAARFHGDGSPVRDGRDLQGDAAGWVRLAIHAAGLTPPSGLQEYAWRERGDYGERSDETGDYLANAIAAGVPAEKIAAEFGTRRGLERSAGEPGSGLDAAAAWAVAPFTRPALRDRVRRTLRLFLADRTRYGIEPAEDWPGEDPWTAPTAWTAWALASLGDRGGGLRLLDALRRSATPAGTLPERVDRRSGIPRSTTPLAWSHAFAVLALRELFPSTPSIRQASRRWRRSPPD